MATGAFRNYNPIGLSHHWRTNVISHANIVHVSTSLFFRTTISVVCHWRYHSTSQFVQQGILLIVLVVI